MFCKNCGNQLPDNAEMCPACGSAVGAAPVTQQPVTYQPVQTVAPVAGEPLNGKKGKKAKTPKDPSKKGGKKKIIIPVVALLLVAAIAVSVLLIFQNPAVKVLSAAKKTVFESSEIKITIVEHDLWSDEYYDVDEDLDDTYEIELFFGENIEESEATIVEKGKYVDRQYESYYDDYYGYYDDYENYTDVVREYEYKYSYKNGKFYEDGEKLDEDINSLAKMAEEFLSDEFDIDIDLIDVANMVIKGKIDEKGLAEVFNTIVVPNVEKVVNEYLETELDIPEFEGLLGNVEDFIAKAYKDEAITLEKTKSKNKGTTYEYEIKSEEFAKCFLEYVQEEEELNKYLQYVVDECKAQGYDDFDDVEDLIELLETQAEDLDENIEGEITIKGGRITNLTIGCDGDTYYTITIESKK